MFSAIVRRTIIRTFAKAVPKKTPAYVNRKVIASDITQLLKEKPVASATDWKNIRNEVLKKSDYVTEKNVDLLTMECCLSICDYSLGKSYLDFMQQIGIPPNLAVIGKFLRLFYYSKLNSEISKEEEDTVLNM